MSRYVVKVRESNLITYTIEAESKQGAVKVIKDKDPGKVLNKDTAPLNQVIESVMTDKEAHLEFFENLRLPPVGSGT